MIDDPRKPRAYSYLRYSTPEQGAGDSVRRQTDLAARYAAVNGLELDEKLTFSDCGVSAFRGKNASAGKLGEFLEHVRSGEVPNGSYLLVESLDRITRQQIAEAQLAFLNILREGVVLVTLMDERKYTWESANADMVQLIISLAILSRGHEESATKSRRLKEAWGAKRAIAASKPITSKCPAWLKLNRDAACFEVLEERAALVRRIFDLALVGTGKHKIASIFNQEQIAPWGRAQHWQRSYIDKILGNPAVIGTMIPHVMEHGSGQKRRVPLDPLTGYYPAVVEASTFAEAQAIRDTVGNRPRGVHTKAPLTNILASMAACPDCGSTMTRVQKGARSKPSFVCRRAKAGAGCKYHSVPYAWIEEALILRLPARLKGRDGQEAGDSFDLSMSNLEAELDAMRATIESLLANMAYESSPALSRRLRDVEKEYEVKRAELATVRERKENAAGLSMSARIAKAVDALRPEGGELDRALVNHALSRLFRKAVINWREGQIELEWTHGGTCEVPYALSQSA